MKGLHVLAGMLTLALLPGFHSLKAAPARQEVGPAAEIHVVPVRDNIYMLTGAGGDITVQMGADGLLLVDAGRASMSEKVLAAIHSFTKAPIRQIILTHDHQDSAGGVAKLRLDGNAVLGGNFSRPGASILVHEKAYLRLSAALDAPDPLPAEALPTDSYANEKYDFYFNGEAVEVLHQSPAHTDGDSMVFFRKSDVLSTGDIFTTKSYPVIDEARGGNINGVIDTLNRIIDITVPSYLEEGGTLVIPGQGRICDEGDLAYYRYMVTVIRDRIKDMVRKGMTLEQVRAARPTLDYDGRYGSNNGPWTTDMFIAAVYRGVR